MTEKEMSVQAAAAAPTEHRLRFTARSGAKYIITKADGPTCRPGYNNKVYNNEN
jgi:hypothetical protein